MVELEGNGPFSCRVVWGAVLVISAGSDEHEKGQRTDRILVRLLDVGQECFGDLDDYIEVLFPERKPLGRGECRGRPHSILDGAG